MKVMYLLLSLATFGLFLTVAKSADLHGGLVVQIGADELETPIKMCESGRYLIHVVDSDSALILKTQQILQDRARYGLVWAEAVQGRLPYSENVVNLIRVTKPQIVIDEILRVLTPRGQVFFPEGKVTSAEILEAAGFEAISEKDGALTATKPWPKEMDEWTHPRHDANGNAVSTDTIVGPPDRVRWVAGATSEVEGLVTASGRNFYGGLLARDSFNGLRLWHHDLGRGITNGTDFKLPNLSANLARPVASDNYLFAISKGKLVSFNAATGEMIRTFDGLAQVKDLIYHRSTVIATDATAIRAYSAQTGLEIWKHEFAEARNVAAINEIVTVIHGRPNRGETSKATALDLYTGKPKWEKADSYLDKVYRTVMFGDQIAYEVSSLNDNDKGNAIHIVASETGAAAWDKAFPPGMNHNRQARAMFLNDDIWILHGAKLNYDDKANTKRVPVEVSALDPLTGATKKTHSAGMTHCFPPVATPKFVIAGELDMTDVATGDTVANRITKANCSRENGWVPANGLIYTTPKHCTCWPMLRGFVAMAPVSQMENHPAHRPIEQIDFSVVKGPASADPAAPAPGAQDWPLYRNDHLRSGSSASAGPGSLEQKWGTVVASSLEMEAAKAGGTVRSNIA